MGHSNFRVRKVTKVTLNTYGWPRIPYSKPSFQSVDWQLGNAEWNILKESWFEEHGQPSNFISWDVRISGIHYIIT